MVVSISSINSSKKQVLQKRNWDFRVSQTKENEVSSLSPMFALPNDNDGHKQENGECSDSEDPGWWRKQTRGKKRKKKT
ncbi:hypothetical protein RND71_022557 [Anisodus tanguticus]|uniref:Uncharacterized protein n=1 Tax=Anisodus tanguticus TaxID=243964 RepID=A0AAE1V684_9SOLA|nr:hypothetical protein RND71_022557 [Anisodus tanguticus]